MRFARNLTSYGPLPQNRHYYLLVLTHLTDLLPFSFENISYITPIPLSTTCSAGIADDRRFHFTLEGLNTDALITVAENEDVPEVPAPEDVPPATSHSTDYNPSNYVFSVPYSPKGNQVIGREAALDKVLEELTRSRRTAIGQRVSFQGLGGLGKTQLAIEYAYYNKARYPNGVIWLTADSDIDAQLTRLVDQARWISPDSEHKHKLDIAVQRIRSYSDCLIIFDNVEDLESIKSYLPDPATHTDVLITSRYEQPGFIPVLLDLLDEGQALELLIGEAGYKPRSKTEEEAARDIARRLDGLPLALELAGAYLRHRPVGWSQYLEMLEMNLKSAMPGKFLQSSTSHNSDLYSTLKIDEEVFDDKPKLRQILDLLTWSGSAPMGRSLLCYLLDIGCPTEILDALGLGISLRLLRETPDTDSYSIHRLVREVRREQIPLSNRREWAGVICERIGDWFKDRREEFSNLPAYESEIDHLRIWRDHALKISPKSAVSLTWLQGYPAFHRGRYQEARMQVEIALDLFSETKAVDRELESNLLNDFANCYSQLGDPTTALLHGQKALHIRKDLFGVRHPDTATSLNNIALFYSELGDHKTALQYAQEALNVRKDLFGEEHPCTANSLNSIAGCYSELGDSRKALHYAQKAVDIQKQRFGERHPYTAISLNNIALYYSGLGDYRTALQYAQKALDILKDLFGERHPYTTRSLNNIALYYSELNDYRTALQYAQKALDIQKELFGENHPTTIRTIRSLATIYAHLNQRQIAFNLIEELQNRIPKDHPEQGSLKQLKQSLLAKPLRPGFRQPPATNNKKRKSKVKRR